MHDTTAPRHRTALRSHVGGATAIEYAMVAAIIGLGIVTALTGTKRNLNVTYDTLSYRVGEATKPGTEGRTVVKTVTNPAVSYSGTLANSQTVTYSDGSRDTILTAQNSGLWFQTYTTHYDAAGTETGADWIDSAGGANSSRTTLLGPTTAIYAQSGSGSCNCTYRSAWSYLPQADGSNMIVYNNDVIDRSQAAASLYQSQTVVYNASATTYDYVGDVSTSSTGVVTRGGQDITKYLR